MGDFRASIEAAEEAGKAAKKPFKGHQDTGKIVSAFSLGADGRAAALMVNSQRRMDAILRV
jgi:hypothetical protein